MSAQVIQLHAAPHRPPVQRATQRPYRLWVPHLKKAVPYRFFTIHRNAHMAALTEARWSKVGTTIEVVDIRNGRMRGQYTRKMHSVAFLGGDNA
jgi:hypothetical protein